MVSKGAAFCVDSSPKENVFLATSEPEKVSDIVAENGLLSNCENRENLTKSRGLTNKGRATPRGLLSPNASRFSERVRAPPGDILHMPQQGNFKRIRERLELKLPVRVRCRETPEFEWTEITRLIDVTPFRRRLHPKTSDRKRPAALHMTIPDAAATSRVRSRGGPVQSLGTGAACEIPCSQALRTLF